MPRSETQQYQGWHLASALTCAVIGAWQAWLLRYSQSVDGYSYLQAARLWKQHSPDSALNGYWSPLFTWLLAILEAVVPPGPGVETRTIALGNLLVLLLAIAAFYVFWNQLEQLQAESGAIHGRWFIVIGWGLFAWACEDIMTLDHANSDRLTAVMMFLAAALHCRGVRRGPTWWTYLLLGLTLGFSGLARAAQFVLAPSYLIPSAPASRETRRSAIAGTLLATAAFLSIAVPWSWALSTAFGHFTFGTAGIVNYAADVEGLTTPFLGESSVWQGDEAHGRPTHLPRTLHREPWVVAPPAGLSGGYWNDPSWGVAGYSPRLAPARHLRRITVNLVTIYELLLWRGAGWLCGALLLLPIIRKHWSLRRTIREGWFLWFPGLAGLAGYASLHVEPRFIVPSIVLVAAGILRGLNQPEGVSRQPLVVAALIVILGYLGLRAGIHLVKFGWEAPSKMAAAKDFSDAANEARQLGLQPGDALACSTDDAVGQIAMAGRFVCTVRADDSGASNPLLPGNPAAAGLFQEISRLGCKAAIVRLDTAQAPPDWRSLGRSGLHVFARTVNGPGPSP